MRCDINVSVNREGEPFGVRCEVKNINSVRYLMSAIRERSSLFSVPRSFVNVSTRFIFLVCEVQRHIDLLVSGQPILQETRGYDEERAMTYSLRSKEDAPDYRYMPDPNLPPLILTPVRRRSTESLPLPRIDHMSRSISRVCNRQTRSSPPCSQIVYGLDTASQNTT